MGGSVESVDASIVWGMTRGILVWWWMSRGGLGGGVVGKAAEVTSRVSRNMGSGAERNRILLARKPTGIHNSIHNGKRTC